MPEFRLPDLGEGLTEAEIIAWHVKVGDTVTVDQVVAEVETAKAAVEVPVPFAGTVTALHAEPGQTLAVGEPLISLADGDQPAGHAESAPGANVLVGYGVPAASPPRTPGRPAAAPSAGPVASAAAAQDRPPARVAVISPLVRKLARDAGLDLSATAGSGPSGLVLRRDVEQAIKHRTTAEPAAVTQSATEPGGTAEVARRIPLRGIRRATAEKLSRSRREIPEATIWVDADATNLLAARAELNARRPERPVSLLALVARFAILALQSHPELNGRIEADEIVLFSAVHLGFAVQTDRGLVVPVVHDAGRLSTRRLAAAMTRLTQATRTGTASPAELTGGTFTVNNYGIYGVDGSAAIINHPEAAILGLGRIIDKPWVAGGQLAIRKLCQLTLAFDHRICDGATAGQFLRQVADCVESPVSALGDL
jgi:2-oxoisovalerate dehydrogenase E2 component (dihydrolipoyl transacylase)